MQATSPASFFGGSPQLLTPNCRLANMFALRHTKTLCAGAGMTNWLGTRSSVYGPFEKGAFLVRRGCLL